MLRQGNAHFHEDAVQLPLQPVAVPVAGSFETWLYLDPENTPSAVSVVLGTSRGNRRFWWGDEKSSDGGLRGAKSEERVGGLPPPGAWTKLSFSAESLNLKPGDMLNAVTVQEAGGVACWDAFAVSGASVLATDPAASFLAWRKRWPARRPATCRAS